jgi:hypothetical protein
MKRHFDSILSCSDINFIDRLTGNKLPDSLKRYLYEFYGPEGELQLHWKLQGETMADCTDEKCNGCGCCQSFCEDDLLEQLFVLVFCFRHDIFDAKTDCYETLRSKVVIETMDDYRIDQDAPF